jgi:ubiquinone/menaquinone biosynthesis C-methylase UbiE
MIPITVPQWLDSTANMKGNPRGQSEGRMDNRQLREVYDKRAAIYDAATGRGGTGLVRNLRARFGDSLRGKTLEIAIGSGRNLPYYSSHVTRSVGIDLSSGMVEVAAKRARELHRSIDLLIMDAQRLAFPDHIFDTVAVSLGLCTIPDPKAALREMSRVCKSDGQIVLLEHVRSPMWPVAAIQRLVSPIQERLNGCHLARETIGLARECGLEIEREDQRLLGIMRLVIARPARCAKPANLGHTIARTDHEL